MPVELFQTLEDAVARCYTQYASKFGKLIPIPKKGKAK